MKSSVGKLLVAICISGSGSTMREILRASKDHRLPHVHPALIISSKVDAGGIEKALAEGFSPHDICVMLRRKFKSEEAFGEAIIQECLLRGIDVIALCGFLAKMRSE